MNNTISIERAPITNLFHDPGYIYISNIEPDVGEPIEVRLRTVRDNVTEAYVEVSTNGTDFTAYEMKKEKVDNTGKFEYFIGTIPGQSQMFKYRFLCKNEDPENTVYYARTYVGPTPQTFTEVSLEWDNCWAMNPKLHTPDWAKGALWYSIMPDCFYNGDTSNDETFSGANYSNAWNRTHFVLGDKYGGDLKGILKKLDYVKGLGAEAIFMDPVFKSQQNAGYGPEFYKQVEHSFGNKNALVELSKGIHDHDMKFIVDVVFSFVQPHSIWYNKDNTYPFPGAQQDWENQYHDWFWFTGEEGDTKTYKSLWAGIEINHCNEEFCKEIYSGEDAYLPRLLKEPFNFDGFRYDTGGALYGIDEDGNRLRDPHVVGKMRPYLKACNPDAMIMSEYSMHPSMDAGTWDARWNLRFVQDVKKYITGELPESEMHHWFDFEVLNIPRTAALCQYFALSDHDRLRNHHCEYYTIRPAQIMLMTMVGAPCIYYGDEFNITREDQWCSFYAMDWKENHWDYDTLNFYKMLTDMRKQNSCLRSGIVKFISVDDENHVLAYARKDENGTAVAIASRNPYSISFTVDVNDLGEVDGCIFTDWLTGKQYVAKDGYIDVDVMAGGTVLVKGTKSAENKGGFVFTSFGDGQADAVLRDLKCFEVNGKGDFENYVFANTDVFNTCEVTAKVVGENGNAALLIKNDLEEDSAFVAAGIENGKLYTAVREENGKEVQITVLGAAKDVYIRIARDKNNCFKVLTTKIPGSVWEEEASVYAQLNNHAKAGFTVLDGKMVLDNVKVAFDRTTVKCDDFKHQKSAMFDYADSMELTYTEDGLAIAPNGHTELLTNSQDEDWTFKAEFTYTAKEENYAGVICKQDEDNYVVAGRKVEDGKPVFFLGRANAGELITYFSVPDTKPEEKAIVQLQRIGTAYSAIFSYDEEEWNLIGKELIASLCVERVGLVVHGEENATYRYASFGNAICDGESVNVPRTPGEHVFDYSHMQETQVIPAYRIVSGDWAYANEGYIQKSTGIGQMGISNKTYGDFKVDATYVIDSGEGFVGFEFGKESYDSALGDGILFCYDHTGKVSLTKAGNELAGVQLEGGYGVEQRLAVEFRYGYFTVFAGEEGRPIMHIPLQAERGSIAYFTNGVVGHINSDYVASNDTNMYHHNPYEYCENGLRNSYIHTQSFANPFGIATTDYVATVTMKMEEIWDAANRPYAGVYFSGVEAKLYEGKALNVTMNNHNQLQLRDGEKVLDSRTLEKGVNEVQLMICKKGNEYRIYVDCEKEPAFTHTDEVMRGGVISFVSNECCASFKNFVLTDLQPKDAVENTENYKNWMK